MARVELDLPAYLDTVHPVIHPQYLKRTHRRRRDAGVRDALEEAFARPPYDVSEILAHRRRGSGVEYLTHWKDCSHLQATWQSEASLAGAQRCVEAYKAKQRLRERPPEAAAGVNDAEASAVTTEAHGTK